MCFIYSSYIYIPELFDGTTMFVVGMEVVGIPLVPEIGIKSSKIQN